MQDLEIVSYRVIDWKLLIGVDGHQNGSRVGLQEYGEAHKSEIPKDEWIRAPFSFSHGIFCLSSWS